MTTKWTRVDTDEAKRGREKREMSNIPNMAVNSIRNHWACAIHLVIRLSGHFLISSKAVLNLCLTRHHLAKSNWHIHNSLADTIAIKNPITFKWHVSHALSSALSLSLPLDLSYSYALLFSTSHTIHYMSIIYVYLRKFVWYSVKFDG